METDKEEDSFEWNFADRRSNRKGKKTSPDRENTTNAEFRNSPVYKVTAKELTLGNSPKEINQTVREQTLGLIMK
jgi:hypothetical protein